MDPNLLMAVAPDYYGPRFDAIKELRDADDGSLHSGSEFRRVASFVNVPLANAITTVLDPEWMKDKKKFYSWLRRNQAYCTYQIKSLEVQRAIFDRDFGHIGRGLVEPAQAGSDQWQDAAGAQSLGGEING
jgi:hypothetical protein